MNSLGAMLIDTHTHLESFARKGELPGILERAKAAGVSQMITIGTDTDDWELYRGLAGQYPGIVRYTVGLHPCSVGEDWAERVGQIEKFWSGTGLQTRGRRAEDGERNMGLETHATTGAEGGEPHMGLETHATKETVDGERLTGQETRATKEAEDGGRHMGLETHATKGTVDGERLMGLETHATSRETQAPRPVAVGETGLDRFHLPKDDAAAAERILGWQRAAFAEQMKIAARVGCPLVVHSRGAFRDCVEMLDAARFDWSRVVFHCFAEGPAEMRELKQRGGFGSLTGIVTYKTAEAIRAAAVEQGLDRLMIETDAPYLTPMPHRGKPNEPGYVRHTAEFCAKLFGVSLEKFGDATTATARKFFGI